MNEAKSACKENLLRFSPTGYSLGYFVLPPTERCSHVEEFQDAFDAALTRWRELHPGTDTSLLPRWFLFALAGRCDMLVVVEHLDFRFATEMQNALARFRASQTTWVHATHYRSHEALNKAGVATDLLRMDFRTAPMIQIFLRIRRRLDTPRGLEPARRIADRVRAVLDAPDLRDAFSLDVLATLGWPDCLLWGTYSGVPDDYTRLLRALSERVVDEHGLPTFQKRLTFAGFLVNRRDDSAKTSDPTAPDFLLHSPQNGFVRPMILARSNSAQVGQTVSQLSSYLLRIDSDPEHWAITSIDGKWDLLAQWKPNTCSTGEASPDSLPASKVSDALSLVLSDRQKAGYLAIDRFQTHLLSSAVSPRRGPADSATDSGHIRMDREDHDELRSLLDEVCTLVDDAAVTSPLKNEVMARLALFQTTLQDGLNRLSISTLVRSAARSLGELLTDLGYAHSLSQIYANDRGLSAYYSSLIEDLRQWCTGVARVARQRGTNSFASFFNQPFTVPTHRGAVQKVLFVADGLLREFYGLLPQELTRRRHPPNLMALFTASVAMASQRYSDIVEIPSRYAFVLPLVTPLLWHEVGQSVFHQNFSPLRSTLESDLVRDLRDEIEDLVRPRNSPVQSVTEGRALHLVADRFADYIVFRYGFASCLQEFSDYLASAMYVTNQDYFLSEPDRVWSFSELLRRVTWIHAAHRVSKDTLVSLEERAEALHHHWRSLMADRGWLEEQAQQLAVLHFPPDTPQGLVTQSVLQIHNACLKSVGNAVARSVAEVMDAAPETEGVGALSTKLSIASLRNGYLLRVPPDVAVNDIYRQYYTNEIRLLRIRRTRTLPNRPATFAEFAALGFSALQAFRETDAHERGTTIRALRERRS